MGMALVYFGIVLMLLTVLLVGIGGPLLGKRPETLEQIFRAGALMMLASFVLTTVGPMLCLVVPKRSGAKVYVAVSVVLLMVSVISTGMRLLGIRILAAELYGLTLFTTLLGWLFFLVFLRKLSLYIGHAKHASRASTIMTGYGAVIGVAVIGGLVLDSPNLGAGPDGLVVWSAVFVLGLLGAGLVVFVSYANLINELRKLLRP